MKKAPGRLVGVGLGWVSLIPSYHRLACSLDMTYILQDVAAHYLTIFMESGL